jgi:hypothetical protein
MAASILTINNGRLEEAIGRRNKGAKNRKGGALRPRLPVRSRPHARSGRSVVSRDLSVSLVSRQAPWSPMKPRGDRPRSLFTSRLLRRGFRLGRLEANQRWDLPREAPCRLCLTVMRQSRQTVMLPLAYPAAFGRPWQWTTSGLPCPREASACFPEPSDFSAGAFHNRASHSLSISEDASVARVRRCLSPLSTGCRKATPRG